MYVRNVRAITVGLALVLAQGCNSKEPAPATKASGGAEQGAKADQAKKDLVDQDALDALKDMSDYLMAAKTAQIDTEGSLDAVTETGQRIQLDGATTYKIRKPGFVIDYRSDIKNRRFIYDGKSFTVYAPKLGFYASAPAPATNREVLDAVYKKFGIRLPLEDLFRWSEPANADRLAKFEAAYKVGETTIDGVLTEHYAFREPGVDWQLWIEAGDRPLPRKIVIVDRDDPAKPTFTSRLTWKVNPGFSESDFAFKPGADDKKIAMASYTGSGE